MKLFYLAHAGGAASSMYKWSGGLESFIEPVPIELAGRGTRYNEEPYSGFIDAVEDIFGVFKENVGDDDYVLAGHSMGAILIYELYYKILSSGLKLPVHMFFSGSKPPHMRKESEKIHMLEDNIFLDEIKKLGGFSEELLNDDKYSQKFQRIFIPLLREDYRILEDYKKRDKSSKIKCSISVMYGNEDLTFEEVRGWEKLANKCFYEEFNGGHFYINANSLSFTSYINKRIIEEYGDRR